MMSKRGSHYDEHFDHLWWNVIWTTPSHQRAFFHPAFPHRNVGFSTITAHIYRVFHIYKIYIKPISYDMQRSLVSKLVYSSKIFWTQTSSDNSLIFHKNNFSWNKVIGSHDWPVTPHRGWIAAELAQNWFALNNCNTFPPYYLFRFYIANLNALTNKLLI